MKIVALVEVHPLSGEPSFITARFSTGTSEFDMPLTEEQASIVLKNSTPPQSAREEVFDFDEDSVEEYAPSPVVPKNSFPNLDDDALVIPSMETAQTPMFNQQDYYDDEL